jgi:hypothetical protein
MRTSRHAALYQVGRFASSCTDNSNADCTSHCSQDTLYSTPNPMTFAGDSRAGNLPDHSTSQYITPHQSPTRCTLYKNSPTFLLSSIVLLQRIKLAHSTATFYLTTDVSKVSLPTSHFKIIWLPSPPPSIFQTLL